MRLIRKDWRIAEGWGVTAPHRLYFLSSILNEKEWADANCQYFVRDNAHILGITKYDTFIKQNLENVLPKWSKFIAGLATDTLALVDYGIRGGSMIIRPPMGIPPLHRRPPISIMPIPRPIYVM